MFIAADLDPFPCPLGLNPGFYPKTPIRKCLESATFFTADLLLAPGHGLLARDKEQHLGLRCCLPLVVAEAGEASRHRACTQASGSLLEMKSFPLSSKPGESTQTCSAGHGEPSTLSQQNKDTPVLVCQE